MTTPLWALSPLLLLCLYVPTASAYGALFLHEDDQAAGTGLQPHSVRAAVFLLDGQVDIHIQLKTRGVAKRVVWAIPVPTAPEVSTSELSLFENLDEATRLRVVLPPAEGCPAPDSGGCGEPSDILPPSTSRARGATPPVIVFTPDFADTQATTTLEAPSPEALREWLESRGYVAPAHTEDLLAPYAGWSFLLIEAEHGPNASGFEPLRIRYEGEPPTLPLRMTALSEPPRVDAVLWIASDRLYQPGEVPSEPPSTTGVRYDADGRTNYYEWLSQHTTDTPNGLWVKEFNGSVPGFGDVARYYTRWDPQTLNSDPTIQESPNPLPFDGTIDLSTQPSLMRCGSLLTERVPNRCAFNHCGAGATCVLHNGAFACICASGTVAHWLEGPDQNPHVVCGPPPTFDSATAAPDHCSGGESLASLVAPVCRCTEGWAALPLEDETLQCVAPDVDGARYGSGAGPESAATTHTPRPSRQHASGWLLLFLLMLSGLFFSRDAAAQGLRDSARGR